MNVCPDLVGEAALQNTVPGDLAQITGAQLPELSCDGVFLHQSFLAGGYQ